MSKLTSRSLHYLLRELWGFQVCSVSPTPSLSCLKTDACVYWKRSKFATLAYSCPRSDSPAESSRAPLSPQHASQGMTAALHYTSLCAVPGQVQSRGEPALALTHNRSPPSRQGNCICFMLSCSGECTPPQGAAPAVKLAPSAEFPSSITGTVSDWQCPKPCQAVATCPPGTMRASRVGERRQ